VHAHAPFVHVQVLQPLGTSAPATEHWPPGTTRSVVLVEDVELEQATVHPNTASAAVLATADLK
jgi:hypothetical protein